MSSEANRPSALLPAAPVLAAGEGFQIPRIALSFPIVRSQRTPFRVLSAPRRSFLRALPAALLRRSRSNSRLPEEPWVLLPKNLVYSSQTPGPTTLRKYLTTSYDHRFSVSSLPHPLSIVKPLLHYSRALDLRYPA
ncbi:hypothetical protein OBBRIDRAFT_77317 [Obba rivulosa]|uniref:Uncharacterized protein n=1 Tax=Obba rivulosa TaxID=1052685 RepID=A0A8E2DSA0_9APHY|nr:hypothetical protein OBBRIDRAFT_77317 [Obba rivulosa]